MMNINENLKNIIRWKAPKRNSEDVLLDLNENQYVNRELVDKIIKKINFEFVYRYPEYDDLLNELEKYTSRNKNNILLTNGAEQGIELVFKVFAPNKKIVIVMPTFSYFEHVAKVEGIKLVKTYYNKRFEFPVKDVLKSIDESIDGVVIVNPSNPLGVEVQKKHIEVILQKAKMYNKFVLIDEVYYEFYGKSFLNYIDEFDNLIILRSFSKGFGLAGLRIGYILSSQKNIEFLLRARGPWDINSLSVLFATEVLKEKEVVFKSIKNMEKVKKKIMTYLKNRGCVVPDSKTNFISFRVKDSGKLSRFMKEKGIYVLDLDGYPSSNGVLENMIRMSVPRENDVPRVIEVLDLFGWK